MKAEVMEIMEEAKDWLEQDQDGVDDAGTISYNTIMR